MGWIGGRTINRRHPKHQRHSPLTRLLPLLVFIDESSPDPLRIEFLPKLDGRTGGEGSEEGYDDAVEVVEGEGVEEEVLVGPAG